MDKECRHAGTPSRRPGLQASWGRGHSQGAWGPADPRTDHSAVMLAEGTAGLPGVSSVPKHLRGMSFIHLFRPLW